MNKTAPKGWLIDASGDDGFRAQTIDPARPMVLIASWGDGWEHVSVSTPRRCPTWEEMESVAAHFWPNETAMQLHVPASDHINCHPYCLHWWRPTTRGVQIPRPPAYMIGPTT